jgi:Fe-S oxidoreductase
MARPERCCGGAGTKLRMIPTDTKKIGDEVRIPADERRADA